METSIFEKICAQCKLGSLKFNPMQLKGGYTHKMYSLFALLLDEEGKVHSCGVCEGDVKNSVGAGDSMVAGFVAGTLTGDYSYALKLGTAVGGATAFSDGLAKKEDIIRLLKQL